MDTVTFWITSAQAEMLIEPVRDTYELMPTENPMSTVMRQTVQHCHKMIGRFNKEPELYEMPMLNFAALNYGLQMYGRSYVFDRLCGKKTLTSLGRQMQDNLKFDKYILDRRGFDTKGTAPYKWNDHGQA